MTEEIKYLRPEMRKGLGDQSFEVDLGDRSEELSFRNFLEVSPSSEAKHLSLSNSHNRIYSWYVKGDLDCNIGGAHNNVFIEGDIKEGRKVRLRNAILSARVLEKDTQLTMGGFALLGNFDLSKYSPSMKQGQTRPRAIIEVRETRRLEAFERLAGMRDDPSKGDSERLDPNCTPEEFAETIAKFRSEGLVGKIICKGDDELAKSLEAMGFELDPGRIAEHKSHLKP